MYFLFRVLFTIVKTPKIPRRNIRKNKSEILVDLFIINHLFLTNLWGNFGSVVELKLRKL